MTTATLLYVATLLLGLTAVGGLVMAAMRFMGHDRPPSWFAMGHGLLAGSGLTLLLFGGLTIGIPRMAWIGTLLLIAAALGGVYLNLAFHDKRLALPKTIVVVHAAIAVVGFALVLTA